MIDFAEARAQRAEAKLLNFAEARAFFIGAASSALLLLFYDCSKAQNGPALVCGFTR